MKQLFPSNVRESWLPPNWSLNPCGGRKDKTTTRVAKLSWFWTKLLSYGFYLYRHRYYCCSSSRTQSVNELVQTIIDLWVYHRQGGSWFIGLTYACATLWGEDEREGRVCNNTQGFSLPVYTLFTCSMKRTEKVKRKNNHYKMTRREYDPDQHNVPKLLSLAMNLSLSDAEQGKDQEK